MVLAIRYDTTTQEMRSTAPKSDAIEGSAVATMVWSATAMNIGSMIEGKTRQNSECEDGFAAAAVGVAAAVVSASVRVRSSSIQSSGRQGAIGNRRQSV